MIIHQHEKVTDQSCLPMHSASAHLSGRVKEAGVRFHLANNLAFPVYHSTGCAVLNTGKVKACFYIAMQLVGPLKAPYASPPGGPIHSGTNSTSLGSILAMQQFVRRLFTHISTTVYSRVQIYLAN